MTKDNLTTKLSDEALTPLLRVVDVIGSAYADADLESRVNHWLDHYTIYGESHYSDTKDWKIMEIYWDKILDRVLNELEITEEEVEPMADRISALF